MLVIGLEIKCIVRESTISVKQKLRL